MHPSDVVTHAQSALEEGDLGAALEITEHVIARFPRHARARLVRALISIEQEELDHGLDDLRFVTSAEPLNARAAVAYAQIFERREDIDRAKDEARRAVELAPDLSETTVLEDALNILGVDVDAVPVTWGVFARIQLRSGWPGAAERYGYRALSEHPDRIDIRLTYAEALWRTNRLSACAEQCTIIFDRANDCVRAAVMLAHILAERGRMAEGQDLLSRAGEIDPEYDEARRMLAELEIHRLVLPDPPHIDTPISLRGASGVSSHSSERLPSDGGSEEVTGEASVDAGEMSGESDDVRAGITPNEVRAPSDSSQEVQDVVTKSPDLASGFGVSHVSTGLAITPIDWARDLIRRSEWIEAKRVLQDIVSDGDFPVVEVDALLEEASGYPKLAEFGWQLLGDFRMRTERPQAAAEAYLSAARLKRVTND